MTSSAYLLFVGVFKAIRDRPESVNSWNSPKQDHRAGPSRVRPNVTNAITEKLRTKLTIGHVHQWMVGHNCPSQIVLKDATKRLPGTTVSYRSKIAPAIWGS